MTAEFDEAAIRHWLVDYLVTNIGCSPDEIDLDAPLNDLAVGSSDAVVLTGELSELLGRTISPVEFWQYPTISSLAKFLTGGEVEPLVDSAAQVGSTDEAIAVVGLGCRLPGDVHGPDEYWNFLMEGRSGVREVPPERWKVFENGSPEDVAALAGTTRWGSFLSDVDAFDAEFFEISPSEADKMDPQQRLLLEVTHEALEHAGIPAESLRHSQTGVFAGACVSEYAFLSTAQLSQVDSWSGTGGALSIIANRVSYFFDLRGPSVTVDTACSSSLVAIHLACQSLRSGDSNLALAGGVNLVLAPAVTRSFDQLEAMSRSGRCHAFDARADGFVRGEGAGVAVLKRLSDAVRDGDRVLAVIRGSAVNQDGRSNGLMAPNPAAQMAVLRWAYAAAGVEPREVDYVEAHGTGTLLGDPIEARALGTVLGRGRGADAPLLIGSVKSNLGHLEAAAGIAGFAKAVLALTHQQIPANLGYESPNPHIPFDKLRLKVVDAHTDWAPQGRPRRAGVSSFGFGGTNAHIVLEQAPAMAPAPAPADPVISTLVISGKNPARIASTAAMLADWMSDQGAEVALADIAHTLNHHRTHHPKFATVAARDRDQAITGLRALAAGHSAPGVVPAPSTGRRNGTVFVYSGQGSQWAGMARQLLTDEPAFAEAINRIEPTFTEHVGFSLRDVIANGETVVGIERIQPVLVGIQLALTELWRSYEVQPDAVIGHSMGEVTAAVVSGALSLADGLTVIATRSRLMSRLAGQGAMALIELDADATTELLAGYPDVTLAVHASPRQTVVAGPPEQVDGVIAAVSARELLARRIEVDVASHHPTIDPILPELREALADLSPGTPTIPLITTTVDHTGPTPTFDADYWVTNLRNPVRFSQAVTAAGAELGTFIEVSPHPLLTYAIADTLSGAQHQTIATLQRGEDDTLTFHTNLNATHTTHPPQSPHRTEPHVALPLTPWHHSRHWISTESWVRSGAGSAPRLGTLLGEHTAVATTPPAHLWQARLVSEAKPYPGYHRIQGVEVVPMAVLLNTLSAAAAEVGVQGVGDLRFFQPIVLSQPQVIQVVVEDEIITVSSAPSADAPAHRWVKHVSARATNAAAAAVVAAEGELAALDAADIAELQKKWGVDGNPFRWTIESCHTGQGALRAEVALIDEAAVALLDASVNAARLVDTSDTRLLVPSDVESIRIADVGVGSTGVVQARRRATADDELVVDVVATGTDGTPCVEIRGLRFADVEASAPHAVRDADPRRVAHALDWQPWLPDNSDAPGPQRDIAIIGEGETAQALRDAVTAGGHRAADVAEASCVVYVADTASTGGADLDVAVRQSAEVAALVSRLVEQGGAHPPALWLVTRGVLEADTAAALQQSPLWGLAGVIGAEQPEVWGGLVDLPADGDLDDAVTAVAALLPTPARTTLAWRAGSFLSRELVALDTEPVGEPLRCRADGTYLITGGLGALGLLMAEWLADRGARRLLLAGRTPLPPRREWDSDDLDAATRGKIAAVRALELRGVTVEAVSLDIGSADALRALVARRDADGAAPIRGVIHAAGISDSQLLTDVDESRLQATMWPKIAGAAALHEVFPVAELDFCYLTGTAGTAFGIPGQGAYAAANAYLDALARARHGQGGHTVSLAFVAWQGLGFGAEAQIVVAELARLGSRPITPTEAFAAWEHTHRYPLAQAVLVPMESDDVAGPGAGGAPEAPTRDWSTMSPAEVHAELAQGLRAILASELRIPEDQVEVDLPFAELGLNSVMAMSIRQQAEQLVGLQLSATMLWNHPTIGALAGFLAEKLLPESSSEDDPGDTEDSSDSVLDSLFDSVESESRI
ncbi:type I polyketide synthase [Mycobacterium sp. SMC-4]|uniref:type I polyketide synthase n=1 Tax=Mycobacterium sp. SMC-4 TaxID=2857059 RepID=UPI0021B1DEBC|nr:type I polyketide synthase [Mycobacterium sp. SMC-4]UXA15914.1 acyltransferase domain-containing protein [Mycobacterium sp. SMC-4]